MTYQQIAEVHQLGNPPNTDYQRTDESYEAYTARMKGNELLPDINPTEADADYELRVGIRPSVINLNTQIWGFITMVGPTNYTASTVNCSISRSAIGVYPIAFSTPTNTNQYVALWGGFSGSVGKETGSMWFATNKAITGCTMSISNASAPLIPADFTTGSFTIRA
jgi:hypothetical protein